MLSSGAADGVAIGTQSTTTTPSPALRPRPQTWSTRCIKVAACPKAGGSAVGHVSLTVTSPTTAAASAPVSAPTAPTSVLVHCPQDLGLSSQHAPRPQPRQPGQRQGLQRQRQRQEEEEELQHQHWLSQQPAVVLALSSGDTCAGGPRQGSLAPEVACAVAVPALGGAHADSDSEQPLHPLERAALAPRAPSLDPASSGLDLDPDSRPSTSYGAGPTSGIRNGARVGGKRRRTRKRRGSGPPAEAAPGRSGGSLSGSSVGSVRAPQEQQHPTAGADGSPGPRPGVAGAAPGGSRAASAARAGAGSAAAAAVSAACGVGGGTQGAAPAAAAKAAGAAGGAGAARAQAAAALGPRLGGAALTRAIVACSDWQELALLLAPSWSDLNPTHVAASLVVLARWQRSGGGGSSGSTGGASGIGDGGGSGLDPGLELAPDVGLELDPGSQVEGGRAVKPVRRKSGAAARSGGSGSGPSAVRGEPAAAARYDSAAALAAGLAAAALGCHLPAMTARQVSNVTWALALLQPWPPAGSAAAAARCTTMGASGGAPRLEAAASLRGAGLDPAQTASSSAAAAAAAALQAACVDRWGAFSAQELAMLLYGMTRLDDQLAPPLGTTAWRGSDAAGGGGGGSWLASWFAASEAQMSGLGPRGLSVVLWALAQLWSRPEPRHGQRQGLGDPVRPYAAGDDSGASDASLPPPSWCASLRARLASQVPHLHLRPLVQVAWGLARMQPWVLPPRWVPSGGAAEAEAPTALPPPRRVQISAAAAGDASPAAVVDALTRYAIRKVPLAESGRDLAQLSWALGKLHAALGGGSASASGSGSGGDGGRQRQRLFAGASAMGAEGAWQGAEGTGAEHVLAATAAGGGAGVPGGGAGAAAAAKLPSSGVCSDTEQPPAGGGSEPHAPHESHGGHLAPESIPSAVPVATLHPYDSSIAADVSNTGSGGRGGFSGVASVGSRDDQWDGLPDPWDSGLRADDGITEWAAQCRGGLPPPPPPARRPHVSLIARPPRPAGQPAPPPAPQASLPPQPALPALEQASPASSLTASQHAIQPHNPFAHPYPAAAVAGNPLLEQQTSHTSFARDAAGVSTQQQQPQLHARGPLQAVPPSAPQPPLPFALHQTGLPVQDHNLVSALGQRPPPLQPPNVAPAQPVPQPQPLPRDPRYLGAHRHGPAWGPRGGPGASLHSPRAGPAAPVGARGLRQPARPRRSSPPPSPQPQAPQPPAATNDPRLQRLAALGQVVLRRWLELSDAGAAEEGGGATGRASGASPSRRDGQLAAAAPSRLRRGRRRRELGALSGATEQGSGSSGAEAADGRGGRGAARDGDRQRAARRSGIAVGSAAQGPQPRKTLRLVPQRPTATDISAAAGAFLRLGWAPPAGLLRRWARAAIRRPARFSAQGLTNLLALAARERSLWPFMQRLAARAQAAVVAAAAAGAQLPVRPESGGGGSSGVRDPAASAPASALHSARTLLLMSRARLRLRWGRRRATPAAASAAPHRTAAASDTASSTASSTAGAAEGLREPQLARRSRGAGAGQPAAAQHAAASVPPKHEQQGQEQPATRQQPLGADRKSVAGATVLRAWSALIASLPQMSASASAGGVTAEDVVVALTGAAALRLAPEAWQLERIRSALLTAPGYRRRRGAAGAAAGAAPGGMEASPPGGGATTDPAGSADAAASSDNAGQDRPRPPSHLPGVPDVKLLPLAVSMARLQRRVAQRRKRQEAAAAAAGGASEVVSEHGPALSSSAPVASGEPAAATSAFTHSLLLRCTALVAERRLPLRSLAALGWALGTLLAAADDEGHLCGGGGDVCGSGPTAAAEWHAAWSQSVASYDVTAAPVPEVMALVSAWAAAGATVHPRVRTAVLARLAPALPSLSRARLASLAASLEALRWRLPPAWAEWLDECRHTQGRGPGAPPARGAEVHSRPAAGTWTREGDEVGAVTNPSARVPPIASPGSGVERSPAAMFAVRAGGS